MTKEADPLCLGPVAALWPFLLQHLKRNAPVAQLYEDAVKYEGAVISNSGALINYSGKKTGRSPKDKRVVYEETSKVRASSSFLFVFSSAWGLKGPALVDTRMTSGGAPSTLPWTSTRELPPPPLFLSALGA